MDESRQLLKSIDARPDESIQSIAIRMAPLALVSPNELLRYGLDHAAGLASLPTDANAIHRLGELGGFAPAEIISRGILRGKLGYIVYKREVPLDWVGFAVRRLAPGVLKDDGDTPFLRLVWQLNALDCDVDTGEVLVERCPRCAAFLRWAKIGSVVTCGDCQFDVRHARSRYVPADHLSLARKLYAFMLRSGPPLPEPFDRLDDVTACHAMEWIAYFANSAAFGKALRPSCQNAIAGLEDLYSWPDSFDRILVELDQFRKSGYGHKKECACLVDQIDRAGNAALRDILLARAAETLQAPALYVVADQRRLSREPSKKRMDDL
jgi:hypothetical protein